MQLSITSTNMELRKQAPIVFRGENPECFKQIKAIGYDGVELHIHDSSKIDRKELKKQLEEHELTLTSIGTGSAYGKDKIFLSSNDTNIRNLAIDRLCEHIITAADYKHAVVIIGLIKGKVSDCNSEKEYRENLITALKECAVFAEKYSVYLGVEVINRYESDYMNNIDTGLELLTEVGSPYVQLHIDTYHMNIEETDIVAAIKRAKGKICHVHLADNDRWYVGHGHYNFKETIKALKDIEYDYALAVESLGEPDMFSSAKKSYEGIVKAMKGI